MVSLCLAEIVATIISAQIVGAYVPEETRLVNELLKDYRPTTRPVLKPTDTVDVKLSLTIKSIVDVNLKDEFIALRGHLSMEWKDPLLTWNHTEHGFSRIFLRPEQIWVPDVVLENGLYDEALSLPKPDAVIYSDGSVNYVPPIFYRAECNMNIKYYPFDRQECKLHFESWTKAGNEVNLTFQSWNGGMDLTAYDASSAFELDLEKSKAQTQNLYYECCPEPYQKLFIILSLRRKTLHYLYTILWPSVVISLVSLLVFRLSPESGEKISLGITVLLVFQVLVWSVGEELPENGDQMPILALYLTIIMLMTAISVGMSVLVLNTCEKKATLPKCLHTLFLDKVARILCFKVKSNKKMTHIERKQEELKLLIDGLIDDIANSESADLSEQQVSIPMVGGKERSKGDIQQEILRVLQIHMLRDTIGEPDGEGNEWKIVAQVIDRLFFWFFFIIVGGMALGMLVLIPNIS